MVSLSSLPRNERVRPHPVSDAHRRHGRRPLVRVQLWPVGGNGREIGTCAGDGLTRFSSSFIVGPNETDGATFPTTHANGLTTAKAFQRQHVRLRRRRRLGADRSHQFPATLAAEDDSAPRQAVVHQQEHHDAHDVAIGGALATASQATYQSVFFKGNISTADSTNIQYLNGAAASGGPPAGWQPRGFYGRCAIDLDGDGLPDMGLVPLEITR